MKCVIYSRISSAKQNRYASNISLETQKFICNNFANTHNMKVTKTYEEVYSAFRRIPRILGAIIKARNRNIIVADVSRFSRSARIGVELAKIAIKNKNKLIFVNENLTCSKLTHLNRLIYYLKQSEQESINIGIRVKNSKKYLMNHGMYVGGAIPYGYNISNSKLIKNLNEQKILRFIRTCRHSNIKSASLNKMMKNISLHRNYVPISCYDKNNNIVSEITESLTYGEIADLLNSYKVYKRGVKWTASTVKNADGYQPAKKRKLYDICDNYIIHDGVGFIQTPKYIHTNINPEHENDYATVDDLCLLEQFIKYRELSSC